MRVKLKQVENGITLNGEWCYLSKQVQAGDTVGIRIEQEESDDILPQDLPIEVLYEDDHLLVLNKPAGMIVHPTHGHYLHTLANAVVHYWKERGVSHRFRPIHRLDQHTSGVIAIAKHAYAHQSVSEQMKAGTVDKLYLAIVQGVPSPAEGTIDAPIDRNPDNPHERIVLESGQRAVTHYRTERAFAHSALLRLRLETGRTHQIRVHLKHIGCPILGDPFYGVPAEGLDRQALHAAELAFNHPTEHRRIRIEAPLPSDMSMLLERLPESHF